MTIHWKAVEQYFTVVLRCFFFLVTFTQFEILENLSILDMAPSGVKERNKKERNKKERNKKERNKKERNK